MTTRVARMWPVRALCASTTLSAARSPWIKTAFRLPAVSAVDCLGAAIPATAIVCCRMTRRIAVMHSAVQPCAQLIPTVARLDGMVSASRQRRSGAHPGADLHSMGRVSSVTWGKVAAMLHAASKCAAKIPTAVTLRGTVSAPRWHRKTQKIARRTLSAAMKQRGTAASSIMTRRSVVIPTAVRQSANWTPRTSAATSSGMSSVSNWRLDPTRAIVRESAGMCVRDHAVNRMNAPRATIWRVAR